MPNACQRLPFAQSENGHAAVPDTCLSSRLLHKAVYENLRGARYDGRGKCWERRGRAERAAAER